MRDSIRGVFRQLGGLLFLMAFAAPPCLSQQDRGTILGLVQDKSQSVIAGATVVVTNQATGREFKLITDSEGLFVAPEIPVGTYRVAAS